MRLYLAGTEHVTKGGRYSVDIPKDAYILNSFYYTDKEVASKIIESISPENFLLDSGAFTFRFKGMRGVDINTFVNRYIEFIMIISQALFKTIYEIIIFPVTNKIIHLLK